MTTYATDELASLLIAVSAFSFSAGLVVSYLLPKKEPKLIAAKTSNASIAKVTCGKQKMYVGVFVDVMNEKNIASVRLNVNKHEILAEMKQVSDKWVKLTNQIKY